MAQMGERARRLVETAYFWPKVAQATLEIYQSLV